MNNDSIKNFFNLIDDKLQWFDWNRLYRVSIQIYSEMNHSKFDWYDRWLFFLTRF